MVKLAICMDDEMETIPKELRTVAWYRKRVQIMRRCVADLPNELSIALISSKRMREINNKSRGVDRVTDVLSFLYEKNEGEIVVCLDQAQRQYARYGSKSSIHEVERLVVHGCLHLAGYDHVLKKDKNNMENMMKKIILSFQTL